MKIFIVAKIENKLFRKCYNFMLFLNIITEQEKSKLTIEKDSQDKENEETTYYQKWQNNKMIILVRGKKYLIATVIIQL